MSEQNPLLINIKVNQGSSANQMLKYVEPEIPEKEFHIPSDFGVGGSKITILREDLGICVSHGNFNKPFIMETDIKPDFFIFKFLTTGNLFFNLLEDPSRKQFDIDTNQSFIMSSTLPVFLNYHKNVPIHFIGIMLNRTLLFTFLNEMGHQLPKDFVKLIEGRYIEPYYNHLSPQTVKINRVIQEIICSSYRGALKRLYLESKALELITLRLEQLLYDNNPKTLKISKGERDQLQYAKDIIEKSFVTPPSLQELAQQVHMNVNKLKASFREVFGTTVFGYLKDRRMDYAKHLLEEVDMSITEVAFTVGYNSFSHFSHAFKEYFGISPKFIHRKRGKSNLIDL